MKTKILISACLLGERVRYDGKSKVSHSEYFEIWLKEDRVISICPEVMGGLSVPREKAEQKLGKVISESGLDLSEPFNQGAKLVAKIARKENIRVAILKERSPSCGSKQVYDGSFQGRLIEGKGLATQALEKEGVRVFGESEIEAVASYIADLEA